MMDRQLMNLRFEKYNNKHEYQTDLSINEIFDRFTPTQLKHVIYFTGRTGEYTVNYNDYYIRIRYEQDEGII